MSASDGRCGLVRQRTNGSNSKTSETLTQSIRGNASNRLPAKSLRRADRVWQDFESRLAQVLPDLTRDDCLIISHRTSDVFVQFAGCGRDGMRAEAISNDYFTKDG